MHEGLIEFPNSDSSELEMFENKLQPQGPSGRIKEILKHFLGEEMRSYANRDHCEFVLAEGSSINDSGNTGYVEIKIRPSRELESALLDVPSDMPDFEIPVFAQEFSPEKYSDESVETASLMEKYAEARLKMNSLIGTRLADLLMKKKIQPVPQSDSTHTETHREKAA